MLNFKHKKTGRVIKGGGDGCMLKIPKRFTNSTYFEPTEEPVTHRYDESAANHADEDDDSFLEGAIVGLAVAEVISDIEDNGTSPYESPEPCVDSTPDFGGFEDGSGGGAGATDSF